MKALHIPSLQEAEYLGRHRGKKACTVKLPNGITQMWSDETTQLLGRNDMTKKIMMTVSGSKGKMFEVIDRVFDTVEKANEYIQGLLESNLIKSQYENKDQGSSSMVLSNGWKIECNYSLKDIMKTKPPQKELTEHYPFDLRRSMRTFTMPTKSSNLNDDLPIENTLNKTKQKLTGKVVTLKDLTKDARKARVVLRQLVRSKKITKPARWEWSEGSADLAEVRKALNV